MLTKRIIPCLDVRNGKVVKGIQFRDHKIVGDIVQLAQRYVNEGADELVFYDITASCDDRCVSKVWVSQVAKVINIPFSVAGGIRTINDAEIVLNAGADKISINSPALENPELINALVNAFGQQCVVVGIDSLLLENNYYVYQYTGDSRKSMNANRLTLDWMREVIDRGAGEIVLNCMNNDGVRKGYDIAQLKRVREVCTVPLIASGGAGCEEDFVDVFKKTDVSGALAASVFHKKLITIQNLKRHLLTNHIAVREPEFFNVK